MWVCGSKTTKFVILKAKKVFFCAFLFFNKVTLAPCAYVRLYLCFTLNIFVLSNSILFLNYMAKNNNFYVLFIHFTYNIHIVARTNIQINELRDRDRERVIESSLSLFLSFIEFVHSLFQRGFLIFAVNDDDNNTVLLCRFNLHAHCASVFTTALYALYTLYVLCLLAESIVFFRNDFFSLHLSHKAHVGE